MCISKFYETVSRTVVLIVPKKMYAVFYYKQQSCRGSRDYTGTKIKQPPKQPLPNKIYPKDTGIKLAAVRISKTKVWISWKVQNIT